MNMKSLLLGSAAMMIAVPAAYAADAVVVAEPEPMEYVRICDVYGAGFYYIPGTETCLKVGGYIRYDIRAGNGGNRGLVDVNDKLDAAKGIDSTNDTYYKRARAAMQLDARSETELGTLRGYMHINYNWDTGTTDKIKIDGTDVDGNWTTTNTGFAINHAFIELGGFRIGKTDSMFSTLTGYAGSVMEDDLVPFGPYDTHQIAYTYTGDNGFSASVALEEGNGVLYTIDSYVPHVVAGAAYTQGWGGFSGVVGYDSVWNEWAGKVRLDVKASDSVSLFVMGGYGTDKNVARSFYKSWGGNWAVWGGGSVKVSKQAALNAQVSYAENKDLAVVANVAYTIVPGFKITPEVAWNSVHKDDGTKVRDGFGGMVRFQRSF